MKKIIFLFIASSFAAVSQNNKLNGIYTEYKRTLWNGDDGSKYTIDGKPFESKLQFDFSNNKEAVTYDGSKKDEQTYQISGDTLIFSVQVGKGEHARILYTKYIIMENKNELVLREFKNDLDKNYYLRKFHFKKSNEIQQDILNKHNYDVYTMVEEMPIYKGGIEEMRKFISDEVKKSKLTKGSEKVFLKLLINPEGKILNIDILNNPKVEYVEEAVKITRKFPDFTPGKQNGKPVYVYESFPIKFIE